MNRRWFSCALRAALCVLFSSALLAGCASKPKVPMTPPVWARVPPAIVDALCGKLRTEGLVSDGTTGIVSTTQVLVSGASLKSVAHLYGKDVEASLPAQLINASLQPLPIDIADARTCTWTPLDRIDPVRHVDMWVVDFSSPFVNPFTHDEAGMFARLSLGGHDSQWYWIPLGQRNGLWAIGNIFPLDMHE